MKAYVFPGQGSQFPGMGKELYNSSGQAKKMFQQANKILNFSITDIMFGECNEKLKQTNVTQPAIFLHSVILAKCMNSFNPAVVAGHSLGEFSALTASNYISFEEGLKLVDIRAKAMQSACEENPSGMAAILGIEDKIVNDICSEIDEIIVPANYNCPGQLVISGTNKGIDIACERLLMEGARRAVKLPVGGAFHSPLMKPARIELENAIENTSFRKGISPIYQNVTATATEDLHQIKENLKSQLTSSVLWTQTMQKMIEHGVSQVVEIGPGKVLQNLFKKIKRDITTESGKL